MDIFQPCYAFHDADMVRAAGLYPYFPCISSADGPVVILDGRPVIMLGSNNYLGLTHHPEVLAAAHAALDRYGTGCTGSRFLNGNLELHETLERELAEFLGRPAALVFSSGFLANAGVLGQLSAIPDSVIFSARENHASLIDGARFGRAAEVRVFDAPADLESMLAERDAWPNALVVTDAVFSMTGCQADLRAIAALKARYRFRLYIDDAHGFGVLGAQGRGTAAHQGVDESIDILFATFSKSLASLGGFVAGEAPVIDYLRHKARTLIFSAALPPASAAAALAALRVMQRDTELFARLWRNVEFFRAGVEAIGFRTLGTTTPIVPLLTGSESLAFRMAHEALEAGVFTTPIVHPAVPIGRALIRTSVTPAHRREHLERALEVLADLAARYPIPRVDPELLPPAAGMDFSFMMPAAAPAPVRSARARVE